MVQYDHSPGAQLICVSATMPKHTERDLKNFVDDFVKIQTSSLHEIMRHVRQEFLRIKDRERPGYLIELVKRDLLQNKPVLIFCNKTPTVDFVYYTLRDHGIPVERFHKCVDSAVRFQLFDKFQEGEVNVLVATDLCSRGLDTKKVCKIKHVC